MESYFMHQLKRILAWTGGILFLIYAAICIYFYAAQDNILFQPAKLDANYQYNFPGNYIEKKIKAVDGTVIGGLLFKSAASKGLIFYLHGNGGALNTWGEIAPAYTDLGYDVFMLDYRGYGKSEGKITNESVFYDDILAAYYELKALYPENKIIVLGYSIGTAPAAMLAARNNPKMLILQAPYYSMTDMLKRTYPMLPSFMLKYPLRTYEFVKATKAPVIIFHGDADQVIPYESSLKLKELFKPGDQLITLKGQGHNRITKNQDYLDALKKLLE